MTTAAENERLGVLETRVGRIEADVSEVKQDVKTLLSNQTQIAINLASKAAAEEAVRVSRRQTGVWVRFFSERAIAILALIAAAASVITAIQKG